MGLASFMTRVPLEHWQSFCPQLFFILFSFKQCPSVYFSFHLQVCRRVTQVCLIGISYFYRILLLSICHVCFKFTSLLFSLCASESSSPSDSKYVSLFISSFGLRTYHANPGFRPITEVKHRRVCSVPS